jgi:predicted RNase H-like HicB family nuclease
MAIVYDLNVTIETLEAGDYRYMATSPDLPNLIVAGDTIDEVLANVPLVARALLETMQETGQPIPAALKSKPLPYKAILPVAV